MASVFEKANNAVVLESARNLELASSASSIPTAAPSASSDGVALNGAARCVVGVQTTGSVASTADIWFYLPSALTWFKAEGGTLTVDADGGILERFNCAGFARVYVQDTGGSAGSGDYYVWRGVL